MASGTGAKQPRPFDTDSFLIKVDNCASRTMSPFTQDFVAGTLEKIRNHSVLGHVGQRTMITHEGTIRWRFKNNKGQARDVTITNSYLAPNTAVLLSPQHWAHQVKDNFPNKRGTWLATYKDEIEIMWDQRKNTLKLPLDPNETKVGTL
jgi:hypothetical protein